MSNTQIIKEDNKPVAGIIDFKEKEYVRLKGIEKDKINYCPAIEVKWKNKKWTLHSDFKKELGI